MNPKCLAAQHGERLSSIALWQRASLSAALKWPGLQKSTRPTSDMIRLLNDASYLLFCFPVHGSAFIGWRMPKASETSAFGCNQLKKTCRKKIASGSSFPSESLPSLRALEITQNLKRQATRVAFSLTSSSRTPGEHISLSNSRSKYTRNSNLALVVHVIVLPEFHVILSMRLESH